MILEGKSILVTGGTGSLGKVLVRRILSGELGTPRKVIVLSRDEAKQHEMRVAYLHKTVTTDLPHPLGQLRYKPPFGPRKHSRC